MHTLIACFIGGLAAISPRQESPPYVQIDPREGLASSYVRLAANRTIATPMTTEGLATAVALMEEALALDPDDLDHWRLAFVLGSMAEDESLMTRATQYISRHDPDDESIRLRVLLGALELHQTVEERSRACEQFLWPENVNQIGTAVASRLALDLAVLHQRQGEIEQFSQRLTQAIDLDPANRAAAALAAGFFRMNVNDPFGEAELLTTLMLADPADVTTQVALAQLMLENGAYKAAKRMYSLAVRSTLAIGNPPTSHLLADYAIAQWASGDNATALETIRKRQADMDVAYRRLLRFDDPELNAMDVAKLSAPVNPTLATVRAVILADRNDPHASTALEAALDAHQANVEALMEQQQPPSPAAVAQLNLDMAWMALWLGASEERIEPLLSHAREHGQMTPEAEARFAGMSSLRKGSVDEAIETLKPLAAKDSAAQLALALAYIELDRKPDAARHLLAASRAQPGSLMGIWSAGRLAKLVGQRMPLSEAAGKMEKLIASIPPVFDTYPDDTSQAVTMRVRPLRMVCEPYEPVEYEIEIANKSFLPLALDREGPIRPQVLFVPTVRVAHHPQMGSLRPFVVDIGRRLRLKPRERLTVRFDLRDYHTADALHDVAVNGAMVGMTAMLNFRALPTGFIEKDLLGIEMSLPLIRVEGERVTPEWIEQSVASLRDPTAPGTLRTMGLLSHRLAPPHAPDASQEERTTINTARMVFEEAFAQLDPLSQAWLLSVMARGPGLEGVMTLVKKSNHRQVLLTYFLYHTAGSRDPMLDAGKRGDDPVVRLIAEDVAARLLELEEAMRRQ